MIFRGSTGVQSSAQARRVGHVQALEGFSVNSYNDRLFSSTKTLHGVHTALAENGSASDVGLSV